ncbi:hypothetical protein [Zoogloea sp. LCSB751]|uniref:hypothetical protein n=1 Tax=Zoogloea sp. LCSB751 TaxID=1965277 RepID=UPI001115D403|nr:hypothetical protein [Zoogloea sp. LCSB751]
MQISAVQTRGATAAGSAIGAAARPASAATAGRDVRLRSAALSSTPPGGGLELRDGFNRQASALQQSKAFAGRAQAQLGELKRGLGDALAGQQLADSRLQQVLRRFTDFWQTRPAATAGSVDGALRLVEAGQARQGFRLRGLDTPALAVGEAEKLQFSVRGRLSPPVSIEPGLSPVTLGRRLDLALAPLGVRVAADADAVLQFSAPEADWPAVRDSLQVKGEGRRYPTGQFSRVRIDADAAAIRLDSWKTDSPAALRQTLRDVVLAGQQLEALQRSADTALDRLATQAGSPAAAEQAQRAEGLAVHFEAQARTASFAVLADVLPATRGLTRERVTALLGLD